MLLQLKVYSLPEPKEEEKNQNNRNNRNGNRNNRRNQDRRNNVVLATKIVTMRKIQTKKMHVQLVSA